MVFSVAGSQQGMPNASTSTVRIDGQISTAGRTITLSTAKPIQVVTVRVTAADQTLTKTYNLAIRRGAPPTPPRPPSSPGIAGTSANST